MYANTETEGGDSASRSDEQSAAGSEVKAESTSTKIPVRKRFRREARREARRKRIEAAKEILGALVKGALDITQALRR